MKIGKLRWKKVLEGLENDRLVKKCLDGMKWGSVSRKRSLVKDDEEAENEGSLRDQEAMCEIPKTVPSHFILASAFL